MKDIGVVAKVSTPPRNVNPSLIRACQSRHLPEAAALASTYCSTNSRKASVRNRIGINQQVAKVQTIFTIIVPWKVRIEVFPIAHEYWSA